MSEIKKTGPRPPHPTGQNTYPAGPIRQRILEAAFNLFSESGFSPTSMLDIVTRARVSKRDLYALFRNKHAVLAACIHERTEHMRRPLDTAAPIPQTRDALAKLLMEFGVSILKTVCSPEVLYKGLVMVSTSIGPTRRTAGPLAHGIGAVIGVRLCKGHPNREPRKGQLHSGNFGPHEEGKI